MSKQETHWQIWVMNADGSARRQLTSGAAHHSNPVWSPDGSMLAYYGSPEGGGSDQVFLINVDGTGSPRALATGVFPGWSPDGRTVIYGHEEQLHTIGVDGSNPRVLVEQSEFGRFSPDGRRIAFVMGDFPDTQIYVMDVAGTGRRQLTR